MLPRGGVPVDESLLISRRLPMGTEYSARATLTWWSGCTLAVLQVGTSKRSVGASLSVDFSSAWKTAS